jgi:hypothetical protein
MNPVLHKLINWDGEHYNIRMYSCSKCKTLYQEVAKDLAEKCCND